MTSWTSSLFNSMSSPLNLTTSPLNSETLDELDRCTKEEQELTDFIEESL